MKGLIAFEALSLVKYMMHHMWLHGDSLLCLRIVYLLQGSCGAHEFGCMVSFVYHKESN